MTQAVSTELFVFWAARHVSEANAELQIDAIIKRHLMCIYHGDFFYLKELVSLHKVNIRPEVEGHGGYDGRFVKVNLTRINLELQRSELTGQSE